MREPIHVLVYPARRVGPHWEYLLLRRTPEDGGFWQGVTGGVEAGEALLAAARREVLEEVGVAPSFLQALDYSYSFPIPPERLPLYAAGTSEIQEHVFVASIEASEQPQINPAEHDAWTWCSLEEAMTLLRWPQNREGLQRASRLLEQTEWPKHQASKEP